MIDPVSAFALATAAYNAVKQGIEVGKELHEVSGALGKFFKASSDIRQATEESNKPSLFKKILHSGSVEQEALDNLIRRKTIIKQEYELMLMIKLTYGEQAYLEMIDERKKITLERKKAEIRQRLHRKAVAENIFLYSLLGVMLYICYLFLAFFFR